MGQADGKYWLGNNPNAEVTDAQAKALAELNTTELDILDGCTATAAEINAACDVLTEAVTTTNVIAASETASDSDILNESIKVAIILFLSTVDIIFFK